MNAHRLRIAALAAVAVPLFVLGSACAPECVDFADCAEKARKENVEYTCESGTCKAGSPFPGEDAGTGGGTGTGGGEGTGGGSATGGGGGTTDDAGTGGGGGTTDDAGTGGGGGGTTDDGGTGGGGGTTDDGGTGGGGGATGGGGGTVVLPPEGTYVANLGRSQSVPLSTSTETGTGAFTVSALADAGYELAWNITHTAGGGTTGGLKLAFAGINNTALWHTFANASSPIAGTRALTRAEAEDVRDGRLAVSLVRQGQEFRGQIIRSGHTLWSARLNLPSPNGTTGGAQFVVPTDGGDAITYAGAWTGDVQATMAHIHVGGPGMMGNVVVGLDLTPDAGGLMGTLSRASLPAGGVTDGGYYVNVHTTDAGAGLIRGQLVAH